MQFNDRSTLRKGFPSACIPHRLAADAQEILDTQWKAASQGSSAFKQSTASPLRHVVKRIESILRRRLLCEYARRHRQLRDAMLRYDAANAAAVGTFGDLASTRDNLQYARQVASEARHRAWPHLLKFANPLDACGNLSGWQVYAEIPRAALREMLRDVVRGPTQLRSAAQSHDMRRTGPTVDERRSQALGVSRESYAKSWRRVFEWTYQRCSGLMHLADDLQVARSQTNRLDVLAPGEEGLRGRLIRCLDAEDARERILRTLGQ